MNACNVSRPSFVFLLFLLLVYVLLDYLYSICNGIAVTSDNCNFLIINKRSKNDETVMRYVPKICSKYILMYTRMYR